MNINIYVSTICDRLNKLKIKYILTKEKWNVYSLKMYRDRYFCSIIFKRRMIEIDYKVKSKPEKLVNPEIGKVLNEISRICIDYSKREKEFLHNAIEYGGTFSLVDKTFLVKYGNGYYVYLKNLDNETRFKLVVVLDENSKDVNGLNIKELKEIEERLKTNIEFQIGGD